MIPVNLFVYGTLQSRFDNSHARLLHSRAKFIALAHLPGRLYEIDSYPGAIWDTKCGKLVQGELWVCDSRADDLLARLDSYEKCLPTFTEPHEFKRHLVTVIDSLGGEYEAWTWLYNRATTGLVRITDGCYPAPG